LCASGWIILFHFTSGKALGMKVAQFDCMVVKYFTKRTNKLPNSVTLGYYLSLTHGKLADIQ
jgi:hypothetical protein